MELVEILTRACEGLFPDLLGVRFTAASPDEICAEMPVRCDLCTLPGVLHGGAIMAFADTLGACGTAVNLPEGARTTTIESKTNFFGPGREGGAVRGTCRALHRGRTTMVWETDVERDDGGRVARVTQTQIVLPRELAPTEQMAGLFAGRDEAGAQELMAQLERSGGALYRGWAATQKDDTLRAELEAAAEREDENAALLERIRAELAPE